MRGHTASPRRCHRGGLTAEGRLRMTAPSTISRPESPPIDLTPERSRLPDPRPPV